MIAYKGRLSFKQYLPAKPTKLGIKIWERAIPQNGYCHEFQIYTGKVDGGATEEGLGAIVVQNLGRKIIKKVTMSTWKTSSPLDFSRTCTQKKSTVVGLSVEIGNACSRE